MRLIFGHGGIRHGGIVTFTGLQHLALQPEVRSSVAALLALSKRCRQQAENRQ
jgi:hypothetical protein